MRASTVARQNLAKALPMFLLQLQKCGIYLDENKDFAMFFKVQPFSEKFEARKQDRIGGAVGVSEAGEEDVCEEGYRGASWPLERLPGLGNTPPFRSFFHPGVLRHLC